MPSGSRVKADNLRKRPDGSRTIARPFAPDRAARLRSSSKSDHARRRGLSVHDRQPQPHRMLTPAKQAVDDPGNGASWPADRAAIQTPRPIWLTQILIRSTRQTWRTQSMPRDALSRPSQLRSTPPVALATLSMIFAQTLSISASVRVLSRGCSRAEIASDFLPCPI